MIVETSSPETIMASLESNMIGTIGLSTKQEHCRPSQTNASVCPRQTPIVAVELDNCTCFLFADSLDSRKDENPNSWPNNGVPQARET